MVGEFRVDSYRFLPRSFRPAFESFPEQPVTVSAARPRVPLPQARVALLTSAGLYLEGRQQPFDLERERREPRWGDPTFREIPRDARQDEIGMAHLHLSADDVLQDFNIALPIDAFAALEREGAFGSLAQRHYSFMGYQGESTRAWEEEQGPELVRRLEEDRVDLLILAPA